MENIILVHLMTVRVEEEEKEKETVNLKAQKDFNSMSSFPQNQH